MLINEERRNVYRDLDSLALPVEAAGRLAALGITTLEELRDHWTYGNRELISRYLDESPLRLVTAPAAALIAARGAGGTPGPVVNLLDAGPARPLVKHAPGVPAGPNRTAASERATARCTSNTWRSTVWKRSPDGRRRW